MYAVLPLFRILSKGNEHEAFRRGMDCTASAFVLAINMGLLIL